jgi:hypothetical protein
MPESKTPPDYDDAINIRKTSRRYLREYGMKTAEEMAGELRIGDAAELDSKAGIFYAVLKVNWWCIREDDQDGEKSEQAPFGERCLLRAGGGRIVALSDPRTSWEDDEGLLWRPSGREVLVQREQTLSGLLKGDGLVVGQLATDEELVLFADELDEVRQAFAQRLIKEADRYAEAAVTFHPQVRKP